MSDPEKNLFVGAQAASQYLQDIGSRALASFVDSQLTAEQTPYAVNLAAAQSTSNTLGSSIIAVNSATWTASIGDAEQSGNVTTGTNEYTYEYEWLGESYVATFSTDEGPHLAHKTDLGSIGGLKLTLLTDRAVLPADLNMISKTDLASYDRLASIAGFEALEIEYEHDFGGLTGATLVSKIKITDKDADFSFSVGGHFDGVLQVVGGGSIYVTTAEQFIFDTYKDMYVNPGVSDEAALVFLKGEPFYEDIKNRVAAVAASGADLTNERVGILISIADYSAQLPITATGSDVPLINDYFSNLTLKTVTPYTVRTTSYITGTTTSVDISRTIGSFGNGKYLYIDKTTSTTVEGTVTIVESYKVYLVDATGNPLPGTTASFVKTDDGIVFTKDGRDLGSLEELKGGAENIPKIFNSLIKHGQITPGQECFAAGAPILMADGTEKPIEDIEIGDLVMSFDGLGPLVPNRVSQIFVNRKPTLLELSNGLVVTPDHPFLTRFGEFLPIGQILRSGHDIVDLNGGLISVSAVMKSAAETAQYLQEVVGYVGGSGSNLFSVYNFSVENLHTYVAGGIRVHNDSVLSFLGPDEVLTDFDLEDGWAETINTKTNEKAITRVTHETDGSHFLYREEFFHQGKYSLTERFSLDDVVNGADGKPLRNELGDIVVKPGVTGDLRIADWQGDIINGQQIGGIFGSSLGNYLARDNVFAQIAYGAALDSVFTSVGKTFDIYTGNFEHKYGADVDTFDESAEIAFRDFGDRLAGNIISAGISQLSSFIVNEIIGGRSVAADLARTVANSYLSAALSEVAAAVLPNLAVAGNAIFSANAIESVNPFSVIGGYFGTALANAIIAPETEEAAIVSNVLGMVGGMIGGTMLGATQGGIWGSMILPGIGTFIGTFVGAIVGTVLGNSIFPAPPQATAVAYVVVDEDGRLAVPGTGVEFNDGHIVDQIPLAKAVADSLNTLVDYLGGDAHFSDWGSHFFFEIGRRDGEGLVYSSERIVNTRFQTFKDLYDAAIADGIKNIDGGGDAFGRRIFYYSGWTSFEELLTVLRIAVDYRTYLEKKDIIDALIAASPNSAFAAGWAITLAQAASMGLTNPDALQNKITGTDASETLIGDDRFNDEIIGGAGNDTLRGLKGNDLLAGGAGADILDGGEGEDTASYVDFTTGVSVNLETGVAIGGDATGDILISIERLFGTQFADTFVGDASDNVLAGMAGDDTLIGGSGDDLIEGGSGADIMDGGAGYDIANYAGSSVGVKVWLQEGSIVGGGLAGDAQGDVLTNFEVIAGSNYSDILIGNSSDNMLVGGGGSDFLEGRGGADKLIGGDGSDFADYHVSNAALYANLATGVMAGGDAEGDQLSSVENVIGTVFADMIIGGVGGNIIEGGAGADILDGGAGMDVLSYASSSAGVNVNLITNVVSGGDATGDTVSNFEHIIGSNFSDVLILGSENAIVLAGAGDDVIVPYYKGNVRIDGGAGNDTVNFVNVNKAGFFTGFQRGDVEVYQGNDIYAVWDASKAGGNVTATMFAGDRYTVEINSIEWLRATEFDDIISFDDINQFVLGGGGNDIMMGREGTDTFDGGDGNDQLYGGLGADDLRGGAGNDTLDGEGKTDTYQPIPSFLFPTAVTHPDGSVTYTPTALPAGGNDRLDGGTGNDVLRGNGGNDTYVFGRGYGQDTIADFAQEMVLAPNTGKWIFPNFGLGVTEGGIDTLEFGADIRPEDLSVSVKGMDIIISIRGTDDQVTLKNWGDPFERIENFHFMETGQTLAVGSFSYSQFVAYFDNGIVRYGDVVDGAQAAHAIIGTGGFDSVDYRSATSAVTVNLATGGTVGQAASDTYASVEGVIGSAYADTITGDGADNIIDGGAGADILDGGAGTDFVSYALSNEGVDAYVSTVLIAGQPYGPPATGGHAAGDVVSNFEGIIGSRFNDILRGSSVDEIFIGSGGNDTLIGALGNDTYRYALGDGNDAIQDFGTVLNLKTSTYDLAGSANDTIEFGDGISLFDIVLANGSTDSLTLSLYKMAGVSLANQALEGQLTIEHGVNVGQIEHFKFVNGLVVDVAGIDSFALGGTTTGSDLSTLGTGVWKTSRYNTISQTAQIAGTSGNDILIGSNFNDVIVGGAGDDILVAGLGGANYLSGDYDSLDGGAGTDKAIFSGSVSEYVAWSIAPGNVLLDRMDSTRTRVLNLTSLTDVELAYFDDAIVYLDGTNNAPMAIHPLDDKATKGGDAFTYAIPSNAFYDFEDSLAESIGIGSQLTYSATLADGSALPSWLTFNATTKTFSGTPGIGEAGELTIKVKVTDSSAASVTSNFSLVVTHVNSTPVASMSIANRSANEDAVFSYTVPVGTFTDPDAGDPLSYAATLSNGDALPTWLSFNVTTRTFSGTPQNGNVGSLSIRVTATDTSASNVSSTFTLTVANTNDAPVAAMTLSAQNVTEGNAFSYVVPNGAFTDVDQGDIAIYTATLSDGTALPAWLVFNAATKTFSGTPAHGDIGNVNVKVTMTDTAGAFAASVFAMNVARLNHAPVIGSAIANQTAAEDSTFNFTVPSNAFTDEDVGDVLSFAATLADGSALPNWLAFNAITRTFSGTPLNANVGTISVKVTATDSLAATASSLFSLMVTNTNDAPVASLALVNQTATEDAAFSYVVAAGAFTDADAGDTLAYTATLSNGSALPSWLSFNATTRTFSGTPLNANVGAVTVKVTATDGSATSVSSNFTLTVANTNDAPTVTTALTNQGATEDTAFSFVVPVGTFADVDAGDTLAYTATLSNGSALPSWLSFNAATRTFSGTPLNANVGAVTVKVIATDGAAASVSSNFTLTVVNTNDAPVVATAIANQSANEDSAFSFVVPVGTFSDVDAGDTLTYSATLADGSALPSWLTFNATTRTFSGTPLNANVGAITVKVKATDGSSANVTTNFTLTVVNTNDAPAVATALTNQNAFIASAFSYVVPAGTFSDVDVGDTLTYSATLADGSALPSWLAFNATTRTFSGTPAAGNSGTISVKVKATDSASAFISSTFSLVVTANNLGNDVIDGVALSGLLDGGPGSDTVTYATATAAVNVNLATGIGSGAAAGDTYVSIESIVGSAYNDTLIGTSGNNGFQGGLGSDTIDGGAGFDWVTYVDHTAGITAALNGGTGAGTVTVSGTTDTLAGIEGIIGSAYTDSFTGSANAESFMGGGGNDNANGAGGNDSYYVDLNGRMIIGDAVIAQSVPNGKSSTDTMGDAGQDTLYFGAGISLADIIATQIASIGTDLGLTYYDDALASSGANTSTGFGVQVGGWFVVGSVMGTITNPTAGLTRIETFKFADGLTFTAGGISAASSDMSDVASTFTGTATDDWYSARGGNDILNGNGGNDVLIGGSGADTINGGAGNDVLAGGSGNDSLTGGAGLDLYSFGRGDGVDTISQTGADASGGKLYFGEGIRADQLWFKQVGQDLEVSVIGTTDKISVTGFFGAGTREVTEIDAGGLKLNTASGSTAVSQLVSAMAAFSPPSVGTLDLPSTIRNDASVSTALAAWAA